LQRAALRLSRHQQAEALTLAESTLPYARSHRYRRYELLGLSIISRAHEELEHYPQARAIAQDVLAAARELKDEAQTALALENLAGQSAAMGALPAAIAYREQAEEIHRRQQDLSTLAFDLTNRAELLMRLGRYDDADVALREVEAGISGGLEPFKGRARRVQVLRALDATLRQQYAVAATRGAEVIGPHPARLDSTGRLAMALLRYASTRLGRRLPPWQSEPVAPSPSETPGLRRELRYWDLATRLAAGDPQSVLDGVSRDLSGGDAAVSYEYEWRLAALGAAAARRIGNDIESRALVDKAERALRTVHDAWKDQASTYVKRPDLVELCREAGLNPQS
jgi:tetratricopeptide (TPR) repeat protein